MWFYPELDMIKTQPSQKLEQLIRHCDGLCIR